MLRNYVSQNNSYNIQRFIPVFPDNYIYFDRYFKKLSENKKLHSITISLFEGRVSVLIQPDERTIYINGDRHLSNEIERHIMQLPVAKDYLIKVN